MNPTAPQRFAIGDTSLLSITQLAEATNATFQDYLVPINFNALSFANFCRQYSLDTGQSVLMADETGQLAGLTMLGIRAGRRGWCGGFGIVPAYRGRRLADLLIKGLLDRTREVGLVSLQLEVLTQNTPAFRTYQAVGLQVTRQLVIASGPANNLPSAPLPPGLTLREADVMTAIQLSANLNNPVRPVWQREPASLIAMSDLQALVAEENGATVGVLLYRHDLTSQRLSLLDLSYQQNEIVVALLHQVTYNAPQPPTEFYLQNEPENSPLLDLLKHAFSFQELHRQYEMVTAL